MGKRGQSTTFILWGLIILVLVIGLAMTTREASKRSREVELSREVAVPAQVRPVYDYVLECVKDTGRTGVYLLALQGGYIEPDKFLETDFTKVGYGYYLGQKTLPSKDRMSSEFSKFMSTMVVDCADFSNFKDMDVKAGDINARLFINQDDVKVEVYYPLEIEKAGSEFKISEKYAAIYPIRFGRVYDFASKVVDQEIKDKDKIDLTFLLDSGFDVTLMPVDQNNIIYSITDKESTVNNIPFTFMFANRF